MKKIYTLIIAIFIGNIANAQWVELPTALSGTPNHLLSVFFTNADTGYISQYNYVSLTNYILKTTNGGATWDSTFIPFMSGNYGFNVYSLFFISSDTGFALGSGRIIKTVNGGINWFEQLNISSTSFSKIFFPNKDTGYVVGHNIILRTTDRGNTWVNTQINSSINITSAFFVNGKVGYITASNPGHIAKTTDAGATWQYSYVPGISSFRLSSIFFLNKNVGFAVGAQGMYDNSLMLKTINGGLSWTEIYAGTNYYINSIYFTDSLTGYTLGRQIMKTSNGGNTWVSQNVYADLYNFCFPNLNTAYAVGCCGLILKTINGGGTAGNTSPVCEGSSVSLTSPYLNGATYMWQGPNGFTSNQPNPILNNTTPLMSGTYTVTEILGGVTTLTASTSVVVNSIPQNPISSNNSPLCQNDSIHLTASTVTGATYSWSGPNGFTSYNQNPVMSSNSGSIMSGYYKVYAISNGCTSTKDSTIVIVNPLPSIAGLISGSTSVCKGQNNVIYSVPAITNATSYVWTLPTGAIGTSSTNTITVNYGTSAVSGNISVYGVNSCGNGIPSNIAIIVGSVPDGASFITGMTTVCQGQNNVIYTVPAISNATSYIWTLPTGAIGVSTTNTITVNYGTLAVSGNISVYGVSFCGNGASSTISITVNPLPVAASIITGLTTVCQGQNNVIYTVPAISNATSYIWTLPADVTGTSSSNTIILNYGTSAISGNLIVKGNNSCGNGVSSILHVSVINLLPLAAGNITGNSSVVAGQQNVVYSVPIITNATSTNWDLPIGASINYYSGPTISVNFSQSAVSGNITVSGNNSCGDGPSTSLYVTVNPFNPNCSAQFDLVADTTSPHHYFAVNNASGIPPLQYNWSWGDGTFSTTAYPTHTYNVAGNYKICLTIIDSVGCTTTYCDSSYLQKDPNAIISVQVIPQGSLGINSLLSDKIKIYPNPAKDNLIIELIESNISQNSTISIYNIQGQLCRQIISIQSKTEVDIKDLSTGLYFVKLNNEKESFVSRFVKE